MQVSCISRNSATHDSHDTVNASQLPLSLKKLCYAWVAWHNLRKSVASQEILLRMSRMTQAYASQLPLKKFCYAWLTSHSLRKLVASHESLLRMVHKSQVSFFRLLQTVRCEVLHKLFDHLRWTAPSLNSSKEGFNKKEIRRRNSTHSWNQWIAARSASSASSASRGWICPLYCLFTHPCAVWGNFRVSTANLGFICSTASTSGHGYSCKPNVNLGLTAVIGQPAFSPFHSVGIIKWALRFPIDTARLHSTAGREENSAHSHSAEQCGQRQLVPRLSNWQPQASCLCLEGRLYWCVCVCVCAYTLHPG